MRQTALPRHLQDCVGQTHGSSGRGDSFCVPEVWRRHSAQRRLPAGAGSLRTGGSQAEEGQDGFARVKSAPHTPRRTARAASRLSRSWPAHRLGPARAVLVLGGVVLSPNSHRCRDGPRATPHRTLVTRQTHAEVLLAVLSFRRYLRFPERDGCGVERGQLHARDGWHRRAR